MWFRVERPEESLAWDLSFTWWIEQCKLLLLFFCFFPSSLSTKYINCFLFVIFQQKMPLLQNQNQPMKVWLWVNLTKVLMHLLKTQLSLGSFRKATQRAVQRRKQPTLTVLHSSGRCVLQALSQMSDAAQPDFPSCAYNVTIHTLTKTAHVIVCVHVMHERIPSPRKVSDWLILSYVGASSTTLFLPTTVVDSRGTQGFKLVTMPNAEICTRHAQSNVGVAIAKAPYYSEAAAQRLAFQWRLPKFLPMMRHLVECE